MKALVHVKLYDYNTYIENGYVIFDSRILEVGRMEMFNQDREIDEIIDGEGRFLLPGLINFHTHMYSAFARGFNFNCQPTTFTETLESIWWRMDSALSREDIYWSAVAHGKDLIMKGVVGALDHHASGEIKGTTSVVERAMGDMGIHGLTCFEISDRFDVQEAIEENMEMAKRTGGPFGLHASMTLNNNTLSTIKNALKDQPIHCHVAESIDDQLHFIRTPVERLYTAGLLNPLSILAHCVHITESDAKTIAQTQAIIALNPRSNQNNGVGEFDYSLFKKHDIPIVAGTDGLGADVAKSWQRIYYLSKASSRSRNVMTLDALKAHIVESYEIYKKITGHSLGRFELGYRFDAMLIDYNCFTPIDENNAFSHVFFGIFDDLRIKQLWNGGKLLVDGYELIHSPEVPKHLVKELWQRIEVTDEHKS
jgi:cytosine/adenosine deaminase-related metal-dependent hydrolase